MRRSKTLKDSPQLDYSPPYESFRKTLREIKRRNDATYDGVLGELPDWMPWPLRYEFHSVRDRLLHAHSKIEIRNWIAAIANLAEIPSNTKDAAYVRGRYVPPRVRRDVEALRYIQDISSLGKEDGIEAYLGEGATQVARGIFLSQRNQQIALRQRRKRSPLRVAIRDALKMDPGASSKSILRKLPSDLVARRTSHSIDVAISEERRKASINQG